MKEYEFLWRDTGEKQILVGADPTAALNNAGFGVGVHRAFDWYREIIPTVIGYVSVVLGHTSLGRPVYDSLKFYAVALFTQNNFYAILTDLAMERQWLKIEDPEQLRFKTGFSLEQNLQQIDSPVTITAEE